MTLAKSKILLLLLISSLCFMNYSSFAEEVSLEKGDFIEFGSYLDTPILWKVIHVDEAGNPLLWSEKALSYKAFDSADSGQYNNTANEVERGMNGENIVDEKITRDHQHEAFGNNQWEVSNLRDWLNSSDELVDFQTSPPKYSGLFEYRSLNMLSNPYDEEPGFLTNFTSKEQNLILPVKHKTMLTISSRFDRDGGMLVPLVRNEDESMPRMWAASMYNYDRAYFEWVEDKIFILSIKEFAEYVMETDTLTTEVFKANEAWVKYPTVEACQADASKHSPEDNSPYWLRTPSGDDAVVFMTGTPKAVLEANGHKSDSFLMDTEPSTPYVTLVPALYLNAEKISAVSGSGQLQSPYTFDK